MTEPTTDPYAPKPLLSDEDRSAIVRNLAQWLGVEPDAIERGTTEANYDRLTGTTIRVDVVGRGVASVTLPRGMRFEPDAVWPWQFVSVRITCSDPDQADMWFNAHVGEEFPLLKAELSAIPPRYEVDTSRLRWPTAESGVVWTYCAELIPPHPAGPEMVP